MKISASQSFLLATLAVSSSSSALVAPSGDPNTESVVNASSSSALPSSTSTDSLGPKQSAIPERQSPQDAIAERGLLNTVGCTLAQLGNSLVPLPILNDILCAQGAREGSESSINRGKVHAELSQFSSALNRAAFATTVSGSPSPSAQSNSSSTSSDVNPSGVPANSSRVDDSAPANATDPSASASISSSMSSASIWRAQPTPANSPSLPVDSPPPQSSTSNSTTSTSSGDGAATSSATA